MIWIEFIEPSTEAWTDWRARVRKATERLAAAIYQGQEPQISGDLYKGQKAVLEQVFSGKCVYCESPIKANQPGDVEHYRPKGALTNEDGSPVIDPQGNPHPGYWWLAYDWENLLLACKLCNSRGSEYGKGSIFPLENEATRAFGPMEVEGAPLLMHPCKKDPDQHFQFHETGFVAGVSPEGKACERILGLNREWLVTERQRTFQAAHDKFYRFMGTLDAPSAEPIKKQIHEWKKGCAPYSAMARFALRLARQFYRAKIEETE
jgi:uncharacterized protein (TIGR02646 family)